MTDRAKTLADLAALAGVTPATVSRALAGNVRISAETRQRVIDLAERHGFQLNQTARNLRLGRTQAISVVIPLGHQSAQRVSDPFYTALIGNLMEGLARRDHAMLLSAVTPHSSSWLSNIARSGRVDGVIVLCQSDQDAVLRAAGRAYRPLVVWGENQHDLDGYCCVGTDNRAGGRIATEHLLAQGRRKIAFAGMTDIPELAARYQGYLEAHLTAGVQPGPRIAVPLAFEPSEMLLHETMASYDDVDAVFAASDMIAVAVIKALHHCGRRVPDQVSVVGYDDVSLASHMMPALTTIRQDLRVAAETMLDLLFRRIQGETPGSVVIPLELVRRQSG
ncbi:LacI family DNA-binding transcriptional regulator [Sphingomonas morindae]|uniref:Substrate-binding domain-containing protein n=1 Tax=Sphingomonas morindae TaxID=1541170 RepID=A0ABY4XDS4_9SPHN|nr:substrate-binding domain-containing protein [Sphingomonas morindae]USI75004.1 substrate-binding domain-containing protein [Sphingomonas morindae]